MNKPTKFILLPLLGIGFIAIIGYVVMLLWNAILPTLFQGVGLLDFPKALGLLALCRILFGGFKGQSGRPDFKKRFNMSEKMMNMSDEEKQKFKEEWRNRCGRN